ncbi:MAG: hypothetical protein HOV81_03825 [Kofleriaceae bacterium]|nr:hypothetical protein [Kofleriaceae bacterium]
MQSNSPRTDQPSNPIRELARHGISKLTARFLTLLFLGSGCTTVSDELEVPEAPETAPGAPTFEEWLATLPKHADGMYVVDHDILTRNTKTLHKAYTRQYPPPGALIIHQKGLIFDEDDKWSGSNITLTYCVSDDLGTNHASAVEAMRIATAAWESAANIDFVYNASQDYNCNLNNSSVSFRVRAGSTFLGECNDGESAAATYPSADPEDRMVYLCPSAFSLGIGWRNQAFRHELGHMLGFAHEFNGEYVPHGPGCEDEDEDVRIVSGSQQYGGADPYSVMSYPACTISPPGWLTDYDLQGVASVYGQAVGHDIVPADFDGDGVLDAAVRAGRGGNFYYRVNPKAVDDAPWTAVLSGYGGTGTQVVTGDFNPNRYYTDTGIQIFATNKADISVKNDTTGTWCIDYQDNGFNGFDECLAGYGGATNKPNPPADYDGDGAIDLSTKDNNGTWYVDYSRSPNTSRIIPSGAYASSYEGGTYFASYAIDGSLSTRWSSSFSDPQWIVVDLGGVYSIGRIKLTWEGAYGSSYRLQISDDATNWRNVAVLSGQNGGVDDVSVAGTGRYVRMFGVTRGTQYGYSLYELEVFQRFGQWNGVMSGYGDVNARPAPADYDGDGRADLAVKTTSGEWFIDYSNDFGAPGCVAPNAPCYNGWNLMLWGTGAVYGNANYTPVPADYNGDGYADLAVKGTDQTWKIDYHTASGYDGVFDYNAAGYGDATWLPYAGRFNADNKADLARFKLWTSATTLSAAWAVELSPPAVPLPDWANGARY